MRELSHMHVTVKHDWLIVQRWAEGLKPRPSANSEELKIDEDRGAMLACDEKV